MRDICSEVVLTFLKKPLTQVCFSNERILWHLCIRNFLQQSTSWNGALLCSAACLRTRVAIAGAASWAY